MRVSSPSGTKSRYFRLDPLSEFLLRWKDEDMATQQGCSILSGLGAGARGVSALRTFWTHKSTEVMG